MPLFGILGRTIFDELACKQPLTAQPMRDVGASAHPKIIAASSATIEAIETSGQVSIVRELVETVAAIVKVAGEKAAGVVETAEAVADIAKCVSIASAVFQAVAITARCISMVSEASVGLESLPRLHSELVGLLNCTSRCAMVVVDPEAAIDELRLKHMFKIQEDCMLTLGSIEEQLMRNWFKQAWWSSVVADTESKAATLREKMVTALNTRDIAALTLTVKQMKTSGSGAVFGDILPPPSYRHSLLDGRRSGVRCCAYWRPMEALVLVSTAGPARRN